MNNTHLICPVCRLPLKRTAGAMRCEAGHSFDVAREGYVNLLSGKKLSASVGDGAEMVQARRAFLNRGLYEPLASALTACVAQPGPNVVADVGCGEGYYLHKIATTLEATGATYYGSDVSKPAVSAAAKAYAGIEWLVADTNALIPLADASVDVLVNVFAPRNAEEFARIVRPGGKLVIAIPGPNHLVQVREQFALLGIEADKPAKLVAQLQAFRLARTRSVEDQISLAEPALHDLMAMTPNWFHRLKGAHVEPGAGQTMTTQIEFEILEFIRL